MRFWVARDKNGWLCMYREKPWRDCTRKQIWEMENWTSSGTCIGVIDSKSEIFPDVTWQTEPCEVEIIKKIEEE